MARSHWRGSLHACTQDPDTDVKVMTRVGLAGGQWWGGENIIDKVYMPRIPDSQVKTIMFENGEVDIYTFVDEPTWAAAAVDPHHYFHDKLRPIGNAGVWFNIPVLTMAPMEDLYVRKSLAQGADMQTIISAVMGPLTKKATGYISPTLPCGNPAASGHAYDPDLARQYPWRIDLRQRRQPRCSQDRSGKVRNHQHDRGHEGVLEGQPGRGSRHPQG